jgi:hypothetical protein
MDPEFVEMLSALSAADAEFLVVAAHALAAHGVPRATGDLDLWERGTPENARKVLAALKSFGVPLFNLSVKDLSTPDIVFQIGVAPLRIDILTSITGVEFEGAWARRKELELGGVRFGVLSREDLIQNKRATGRPKDLLDVESLG